MTDRDIVREILKADPISPLRDLAKQTTLSQQKFAIVAWQVAHYDRIDYHAQRLDGRRIRRKVAA